jgi:hypothetical protein
MSFTRRNEEWHGRGQMSLKFSKTKHRELLLLAQRDGRERISQYNLEKEKKERKQEEGKLGLTWLREMEGNGSLQSQEEELKDQD